MLHAIRLPMPNAIAASQYAARARSWRLTESAAIGRKEMGNAAEIHTPCEKERAFSGIGTPSP